MFLVWKAAVIFFLFQEFYTESWHTETTNSVIWEIEKLIILSLL